MNTATLNEAFYVEVIALMVEGVIERPICRYVEHVPWLWWNDSGRAVCGICHPPVNQERAA